MQVQPRALGYLNAKQLTNEELCKVAGGCKTYTVTPSQKLTGQSPGPVDIEIDQVWD